MNGLSEIFLSVEWSSFPIIVRKNIKTGRAEASKGKKHRHTNSTNRQIENNKDVQKETKVINRHEHCYSHYFLR